MSVHLLLFKSLEIKILSALNNYFYNFTGSALALCHSLLYYFVCLGIIFLTKMNCHINLRLPLLSQYKQIHFRKNSIWYMTQSGEVIWSYWHHTFRMRVRQIFARWALTRTIPPSSCDCKMCSMINKYKLHHWCALWNPNDLLAKM